jgi:hypothetical protein
MQEQARRFMVRIFQEEMGQKMQRASKRLDETDHACIKSPHEDGIALVLLLLIPCTCQMTERGAMVSAFPPS